MANQVRIQASLIAKKESQDMDNKIPAMDTESQRLYLNSMLSNPELFTLVNNVLRPSFFDPDLAKGVKFIQDYYTENRVVPATSIFTAMTKIPTESAVMANEDRSWIAEQISEFCRFQACIEVVKQSMGKDGYFERGDLATMVAKMKEASEMGLQQDLGIDYFANPLERLEADELEDPVISTGWKTVDDVIGGGIGLQELVLFLAPSGGGKSVSMLNLAFNLMEQGYDGIYISLEMRDKKVARRTDQMIARFASNTINANKTQVAHEIQRFHERSGATFFIKRMPEGRTTARDIIAYIRQLKTARKICQNGRKLGFVVVDYLDIMMPDQRGAGDSMFLKDKYVSEEVRAIGFDEDCIMISGSQLEKGATDKINAGEKMHQGNVQGGSSKTNTADLMIATVKTDAMHEAGEYRFEFPKARNSDAGTKQVTMKWNKKTLKISDMDSNDLSFTPKQKSSISLGATKHGEKKASIADFDKRFNS